MAVVVDSAGARATVLLQYFSVETKMLNSNGRANGRPDLALEPAPKMLHELVCVCWSSSAWDF